MRTTCFPRGIVSAYRPSASVVIPMDGELINTAAPITGSPVTAFLTYPVIVELPGVILCFRIPISWTLLSAVDKSFSLISLSGPA
ncbi:hypothetical protein D3C87_1723190 [compost metagenome]